MLTNKETLFGNKEGFLFPHNNSLEQSSRNINWQDELDKLKAYKEELPIYTLKEGEFKVFNVDRV